MDRGEDMGVMIDDAVPMPSARVVRRYPYEDMGVGQSFYVEGVQMQVVLNGNWRALEEMWLVTMDIRQFLAELDQMVKMVVMGFL